ncbi:MAG: hypothetical protein QE271_11115 [Bacteriovoracaceae bacterium]|nr:hypothetical protein [Bacteriovoracaceae bacterium]
MKIVFFILVSSFSLAYGQDTKDFYKTALDIKFGKAKVTELAVVNNWFYQGLATFTGFLDYLPALIDDRLIAYSSDTVTFKLDGDEIQCEGYIGYKLTDPENKKIVHLEKCVDTCSESRSNGINSCGQILYKFEVEVPRA